MPRDDRPGRPSPQVEPGEVAFLRVIDLTRFGAFVDRGTAKDLLVPRAEQTHEVRVGERHPIGVFVDETGRLTGTMRISERLREKADLAPDQWVEGEALRNEPEIGLFVILQRAFLGLLPASEPHPLSRGQAARFRVTHVLPDGKIELSLRALAHEELESDARKVLDVLTRPGTPRLGDRSSPEEIRAAFGLSKKAFKRAVGRLLRQKDVTVDPDGVVRVGRHDGR